MPQLKPQLPKVLCSDLHSDVLHVLHCLFLKWTHDVASYLCFNLLCLHSKAQPHFKNSIPKNSNHLLELLPLSNGLPNRFILSPPKLSSTFSSRTDRGVFQVFFTMTFRLMSSCSLPQRMSCQLFNTVFFTPCCQSAS